MPRMSLYIIPGSCSQKLLVCMLPGADAMQRSYLCVFLVMHSRQPRGGAPQTVCRLLHNVRSVWCVERSARELCSCTSPQNTPCG